MKQTKNRKVQIEKVDKRQFYSLDEALSILKDTAYAQFDETVEASFNLGVQPRHADQNIRVTTSLPNGTGKSVRVLVITSGPKEKEAEEAGADYVGKEFIDKIKSGWADVDTVVATPDMMPEIGKLGKILGPKGLMPNPKSGTVTDDVAHAVKELKAGRIEVRVDKNGIIHAPIGKLSFDTDALRENIKSIYQTIMKARPASVKGTYMKKMSLSSTMGPGIKIDTASLR